MAVRVLIEKWDHALNNKPEDNFGIALLSAIVSCVANNIPVSDIGSLLTNIGVDEVNRMVFMLNSQNGAQQLANDLFNFTQLHIITTWNITNEVLVLETL